MRFVESALVPRLEETRRLARVLRIVQIIGAQPRAWNRRKLAAEFEISERAIDNDLLLIRNALAYDLRRSGQGYYFVRGPMLRPLQITLPEALSLALAAQQARETGTVDGSVIGAILAKIEETLPQTIIPYVRRAGQASAGAPFGPSKNRGSMLAVIDRALLEQRKLRVVYCSASGGGRRTERTLAVYHLLPYERSWQVIAHDDLRDAILMFKVDRIEQCTLTEDTYEIPDEFDLAVYLGPSWGILRGEVGELEEVVLHFSSLAAPWIQDDRWHASQRIEPAPDGSCLLHFHCVPTHEFVRWLLSFGAEVTILRPESLRARVVAEAVRIIDVAERVSDV